MILFCYFVFIMERFYTESNNVNDPSRMVWHCIDDAQLLKNRTWVMIKDVLKNIFVKMKDMMVKCHKLWNNPFLSSFPLIWEAFSSKYQYIYILQILVNTTLRISSMFYLKMSLCNKKNILLYVSDLQGILNRNGLMKLLYVKMPIFKIRIGIRAWTVLSKFIV